MSDTSDWVEGIEGDFHLHNAVVRGKLELSTLSASLQDYANNGSTAMPKGTKVTSARRFGDSAWTKTAKIDVTLADGSLKRYFLKVMIQPYPSTSFSIFLVCKT